MKTWCTHDSENASLHSHLGYFSENCGDFSEEQGYRFHQDLCGMEDCYQGQLAVKFLNYCWCLKCIKRTGEN